MFYWSDVVTVATVAHSLYFVCDVPLRTAGKFAASCCWFYAMCHGEVSAALGPAANMVMSSFLSKLDKVSMKIARQGRLDKLRF